MPNLFGHSRGLDERPHMRMETRKAAEQPKRGGNPNVRSAERAQNARSSASFYSLNEIKQRGKAERMPNLFGHSRGLDERIFDICTGVRKSEISDGE